MFCGCDLQIQELIRGVKDCISLAQVCLLSPTFLLVLCFVLLVHFGN